MADNTKKFGGVTLDGVLANRVNHEPLIFRGLTSSELNFFFLGAIAFWLPVCVIFGLVIAAVQVMIGVSLALAMVTVMIGARVFQRVKRNRPDGYFVHKIHLRLHRWKLRKSAFDIPSGRLSLGRTPALQKYRSRRS